VGSFAEGILTATRRAADVVGRLLTFARRSQESRAAVDLHQLASEVADLLAHSLPGGISVKVELKATTPIVLGDASLLQSALLNLGLNARDAILAKSSVGVITLSSHQLAADSRVDGRDGVVVLQVTDNGAGMTEEVHSRLFQPFFTTKAEGTGMGLAVSYGTIRAHGGVIEVESEAGQGTTVRVLLPRHLARQSSARLRLEESVAGRFRARVLLVESEPTLADAARRLLSHLGCQVVHVTDGDAALQTFRGASSSFDVLILDATTGRTDGTRLIDAVRALAPALPVVVSSDPADVDAVQHLVAERQARYLPRPYRLGELSRVLGDGLRRAD
jgi:two-component system cell cycle sensor histidine kinase/response regulator CckA